MFARLQNSAVGPHAVLLGSRRLHLEQHRLLTGVSQDQVGCDDVIERPCREYALYIVTHSPLSVRYFSVKYCFDSCATCTSLCHTHLVDRINISPKRVFVSRQRLTDRKRKMCLVHAHVYITLVRTSGRHIVHLA